MYRDIFFSETSPFDHPQELVVIRCAVFQYFGLCLSRTSLAPRNRETATRQDHYDDIDTVNFNPVNVDNYLEDSRNNACAISQCENSNENLENCDTKNSDCQYITPCSIHQFKSSLKDNAPQSLTGESDIFPSRNLTDIDIHEDNENGEHDTHIEELEIQIDISSIESDNSDTIVKGIRKYETLQISDVNEHSYTTYGDTSK